MEQNGSTTRPESDEAPPSEHPTATVERIVYTIPEIAALLGVDRATVYRWIQRGDVPVVRMGRSRMFVPKRLFLEQFGVPEPAGISS
jgi:excisionase family DNA binding protein